VPGKIKILIVEDDIRLLSLIQEYLDAQGFEVSGETRGDRAKEKILREKPNLVILDLMLPGLDGLSILGQVRGSYKNPILILTAKEDDMDQVAGLEAGADDYIKKPVVPRVLLARIRAFLRRKNSLLEGRQDTEVGAVASVNLGFGNLLIERDSRRVRLGKEEVDLSTSEFDLLWLLAKNSGKIISRDKLYIQLKGYDYDGLDRGVDMAISRLRKKMGDDSRSPFRIKTIWGKGYLFVPDAWKL
jgi:DNA-binding response OmpR family regulator